MLVVGVHTGNGQSYTDRSPIAVSNFDACIRSCLCTSMTTNVGKKQLTEPLQFRIPTKHLSALRRLAAKNERTIAAECRIAVRRHLEAA